MILIKKKPGNDYIKSLLGLDSYYSVFLKFYSPCLRILLSSFQSFIYIIRKTNRKLLRLIFELI